MMANKTIWGIGGIAIAVVLLTVFFSSDDKSVTASQNGKAFTIQSWQSKDGAKVLYVPAPQLPMIDIRVVFDAGSARDGKLPGIASLTNAMLNEGAGEWNADQLAERFDNIGAQFSAAASYDMATLSLRSLTQEDILEQAMKTFSVILSKPTFADTELERVRKNVLIGLENQLQSPGSIASKSFYKALYDDHPYASPTSGDKDSVTAIRRDDLLAFYKQYYVTKNAMIAIVGAVDRDEAEDLAEQVLAGLTAGNTAVSLPEVQDIADATHINKVHPSSQTHILYGQPGVKRGDDDHFALYVGNHILGGSGFGSRVVEEIREKNGLAYSAYSYFMPQRAKGPFIMGLQTSNDQAQRALTLLKQVLNKYIEEGPTEEELLHAKKNITGGFPLNIDSNKDIIGYIAMIGFYGLPMDYLQQFNGNVEAVTIGDIKQAFRKHLHPERMVTVTVGNAEFDSK